MPYAVDHRDRTKAILLVIHAATKHFGKEIMSEQEVLNNISEMMMETYVAESMALRVEKLRTLKGEAAAAIYRDILDVYLYDAADELRKQGCDAANALGNEEMAGHLVKEIESCTRTGSMNIKSARRRIADRLIEENVYKF